MLASMSLPLTPRQARVRLLVLGAWSVLFLLVCWHQLIPTINLHTLGWTLFYSLALLIPLPGLLRGRRYTYSWATLCVLPYFIVGITESVANLAIRNWALSLLGASLLWFFALIAYLRVTPAAQR